MSRCLRCKAGSEWIEGDPPKDNSALEAAEQRILALEAALRSIASNTCCDTCQEAARVAQRALLHDSQERCAWCDPSFGCFNGSIPCSKKPKHEESGG